MKNVSITKVKNTTIVSVTDRNGVKNYSYNKVINPVARNVSNEILIEDPDRNNPPLFIPFSVIENKLGQTTPSAYLNALADIGAFNPNSTGLVLSKNWKIKVGVLNELTSGTLEVGKKYVIYAVKVGDDFSNVGFVAVNVPFIATATTPTSWGNFTEVIPVFYDIKEVVNTTGGTMSLVIIDRTTDRIICSEPIFTDLEKIIAYPLANNSVLTKIDDNTLQITSFFYSPMQPFIIEIYE